MFMEIYGETAVLGLVYRKAGPIGSFIQDLMCIDLELPTEYRTYVTGDFNLDNYCTKIF